MVSGCVLGGKATPKPASQAPKRPAVNQYRSSQLSSTSSPGCGFGGSDRAMAPASRRRSASVRSPAPPIATRVSGSPAAKQRLPRSTIGSPTSSAGSGYLLEVRLDDVHDIVNGPDAAEIGLVHATPGQLLHLHHQIDGVDAVQPQLLEQLGFSGELLQRDLEHFGHDLADLLLQLRPRKADHVVAPTAASVRIPAT